MDLGDLSAILVMDLSLTARGNVQEMLVTIGTRRTLMTVVGLRLKQLTLIGLSGDCHQQQAFLKVHNGFGVGLFQTNMLLCTAGKK